MNAIKDIVYVNVEYFDGQSDEDDGNPYYVALCDELHFVTESESFEGLLDNIKECLELALHDTDSVAVYGVMPSAAVKLVMDLTYAETA